MDRRYQFRTGDELKKISGMSQDEFEQFLGNHLEVVKSSIKGDVDGKELYRLVRGSNEKFLE